MPSTYSGQRPSMKSPTLKNRKSKEEPVEFIPKLTNNRIIDGDSRVKKSLMRPTSARFRPKDQQMRREVKVLIQKADERPESLDSAESNRSITSAKSINRSQYRNKKKVEKKSSNISSHW